MMKILLTNDDGYDSEGLRAVADLFKGEYEITVVAPDNQRSASSHSITLPPSVLPCREVEGNGYKAYAVTGSPADCVKVGLTLLCKTPDLVISGINNGENLGSDILYSGTVSAATEAAYYGVRAVALSLDDKKAVYADYFKCAEFIKRNLNEIMRMELPPRTVLNVNFPKGSPLGVKVVRMNTQRSFIDDYKFIDETTVYPGGYRLFDGLDTDSDEWFCHAGYITVTPLQLDRTDRTALDRIAETGFKL